MNPHTQIVESCSDTPLKRPRNTGHGGKVGAKLQAPDDRHFLDAKYWDGLAAVYLRQYRLPRWDAPCEPEAMRQWLDRLDMTEAAYMRWTKTSLVDFFTLNPTWPLRAFIGTVLEMVDEQCKNKSA